MKSKQKESKKKDALVKMKEEKVSEQRFNYVFYDPEMHWCQTCNVFPKTAKDFLNHLHTKDHIDRERIDTPWHLDMVNDQYPMHANVPTKRTPIRGLTFFVPASSWFCKLCSIWMGDLHCASTHLKSQLHSKKYNAFLEKNPHFEVNWLADRQRVLNEKKPMALPQQLSSVSTTGAERSNSNSKKSKRDDDKSSKKRKKKGSDSKKDKKKRKKKSSKKRKKAAVSSSSSSSTDSSSSDADQPKKLKASTDLSAIVIKDLDNPNPAASIRVAMRKQESGTGTTGLADDDDMMLNVPPPPRMLLSEDLEYKDTNNEENVSAVRGKWTEMSLDANTVKTTSSLDIVAAAAATTVKHDDAIMQQWNTVQPVISESEKKLLEQLKGRLKSKPRDEPSHTQQRNPVPPGPVTAQSQSATATTTRTTSSSSSTFVARSSDKENRDRQRGSNAASTSSTTTTQHTGVAGDPSKRRRGSRSPMARRSRTRSRSRGRDYRWAMRRSRNRSRSRDRRHSPARGGFRGGPRRRSRSRSPQRRSSRSHDRRRRTRSRTRSISRDKRMEKPIVKHSEFRPRVPEKDGGKDVKRDSSSKKSKSSTTTTNSTSTGTGNKKLPFIGKMPVFKKQTAGGLPEGPDATPIPLLESAGALTPTSATNPAAAAAATTPQYGRHQAPTAAQIQMAMMEDVYGNAPPFHPDAGMMVDYDDLMPDPVQFVNLMGQAPPPPPPTGAAGQHDGETEGDDPDMLPPGIDEPETDEFVPKANADGPGTEQGALPKDLEEALNIIFPGERNPDDDDNDGASPPVITGKTEIITDEPVMQMSDLVKEGIHMVSLEETSMHMDDASSQMSMNEPLIFNSKRVTAVTTTASPPSPSGQLSMDETSSQNAADFNLSIVSHQQQQPTEPELNDITNEVESPDEQAPQIELPQEMTELPDIPMPVEGVKETTVGDGGMEIISGDTNDAIAYDLDDIPQPPPSPTESEKNRRQEQLDELAMLGITADDLAAQCM